MREALAFDRAGRAIARPARAAAGSRPDAEVALAESEAHLREAQAVAHLGSWRWDVASGAVAWSDELYRIYGYEPGAFAPSFDAYLAHVHPDDRDANVAHLQATLERDEPYEHEYRILRAPGEMRWLYTKGAVSRDPDGTPVAMHGICLDVTERHEAEQALEESVARLREAQEVAQLGNWGLDLLTGELSWSEMMFGVHGLDSARSALTIEEYIEMVHPEDQDRVRRAGERVVGSGERYDFEYRFIRPDGCLRWLQARGRPVLDGDRLVALRGTVLDITERKEIELALAEREAQLVEAQRVAQMGSFRRDVATGLLTWSPELYRIFGVDPASVDPTFDWLLEQVHPDDRGGVREAVTHALGSTDPVEYEFRIVRPDGTVRHLRTRAQYERDHTGVPITYIGATEDVTERRREEELHRVVSEMVSDILFSYRVHNGQMVLDWVTPAFERITGHTLPSPLPQELFRPFALHEDDSVIDHAERVVLAGRFFTGEVRIQTREGDVRWLRLYAQPVRDDRTGAVVRVYGAAQDVTASKRAEEALRRAYEQERAAAASLREADRMKDEFLSTASHELRTPLAAVVGFASALSKQDRLDEPTRAHLLERLEHNALALGSLVERLLDFSRLQAGAVHVKRVPVDLAEVVMRCVEDHADEVAGRTVDLRVPQAISVLGDAEAITHVLWNLVSNAHKYSPAAGGIEIAADVDPDRGTVAVSVSDQGVGMAPEVAARVFERFYRGPKEMSGPRGSGIGLAIAKSYVEMMGGRIWVDSRPGKTTFSFTLPLASRAAVPASG